MQDIIENILSLRRRDVIHVVTTTAFFLSIILVAWCATTLYTSCDAPIVVVLSGSMEPGYYRGDVLLLHSVKQYPAEVGDIIVYSLSERSIPIVHRVHRIHQRAEDGKRFYLTKGDNNVHDDDFLFKGGRQWLEEDMIIGKTFAYVPLIGYLTIAFNEVFIIKYICLVLIAVLLLASNDEF
ncbi:signal peptidase type I putative serine peptidase Clan SF Family S26A [Leptomonas seymouri]|uniref:Signal peptidase complex catalytic subunit SEC11 n=1 Tax=Leptomonas seymouri TaxID=5684 RepID=A0A0N1IAJ6_LEPSE|nr:signal peptidase type I putative serine peptidase Clan SF Family S26A [Leptomonas seymouri]|eukprot:KPI90631.1 signal peptidase type I putative serine peptidase Clan SF Family S26A [Leptomonas seymouri]